MSGLETIFVVHDEVLVCVAEFSALSEVRLLQVDYLS